jgi:GAF domain-containing protein
VILAPKSKNDRARLNALWGYELLDSTPEDAFDAVTKLAASICAVPIAVVSLVDEDRQWFKSQCGLGGVTSTARDVSFCGHAILQQDIFEVPDTHADPRFADNPLVTGPPHIRFYAGAPLIVRNGLALGTLCVIDRKPGKLTETQRAQLHTLAAAIVGIIETRIRRSELNEYQLAKKSGARVTRFARRKPRLVVARPPRPTPAERNRPSDSAQAAAPG